MMVDALLAGHRSNTLLPYRLNVLPVCVSACVIETENAPNGLSLHYAPRSSLTGSARRRHG